MNVEAPQAALEPWPEPPAIDVALAALTPASNLPPEWYQQRDAMLGARALAQQRLDRRQVEAGVHAELERRRSAGASPTAPPRSEFPTPGPEVDVEVLEVVEAPVPAASSLRLTGEQKGVVHLLAGAVKRGTLRHVDLAAPALELETEPGKVDAIPADQIKAVFFLRTDKVREGNPTGGRRVRIALVDGRMLLGFSTDDLGQAPGLFVVPSDSAGTTERIFVFRAGIRSITEA
jgi:hypothetical protein